MNKRHLDDIRTAAQKSVEIGICDDSDLVLRSIAVVSRDAEQMAARLTRKTFEDICDGRFHDQTWMIGNGPADFTFQFTNVGHQITAEGVDGDIIVQINGVKAAGVKSEYDFFELLQLVCGTASGERS